MGQFIGVDRFSGILRRPGILYGVWTQSCSFFFSKESSKTDGGFLVRRRSHRPVSNFSCDRLVFKTLLGSSIIPFFLWGIPRQTRIRDFHEFRSFLLVPGFHFARDFSVHNSLPFRLSSSRRKTVVTICVTVRPRLTVHRVVHAFPVGGVYPET